MEQTPGSSVPPSRDQSPDYRGRRLEGDLQARLSSGTLLEGGDLAADVAEAVPSTPLTTDGGAEGPAAAEADSLHVDTLAEAAAAGAAEAAALHDVRRSTGPGSEPSGAAIGPDGSVQRLEGGREGVPVPPSLQGAGAATNPEEASRTALARAGTITSLASRSPSVRSLRRNGSSQRSQDRLPAGAEASDTAVLASETSPVLLASPTAPRDPDVRASTAPAATTAAISTAVAPAGPFSRASHAATEAVEGTAPAASQAPQPSLGPRGRGLAQSGVVEQSSQQLTLNSSMPSLGLGNAAAGSAARKGPMVMPFVERRYPAGQSGGPRRGGGSAGSAGAGAAAPSLGLPIGRRQGPSGAIRHGPTSPQQYGGGGGGGGGGSVVSGSREVTAMARGTQGPRDSGQAGNASMGAMPDYMRTPEHTGEGGPDQAPLLPLYQVSSRDWERMRSGYAAGGGAAAVKAAAAKSASTSAAAGGGGGTVTAADKQLQQQLMLGQAIRIRSVHRTGPTGALGVPPLPLPGGCAQAGGMAGVPGRRGRRIVSHPSTASATAAAMAAYFASVEASIADGTAADKVLLPSGLARRLRAARLMASGPPPFQRRRQPPPPPSPAGIKLDGFMLLEAADEEMPEAVQAATLESRHISAVESADLSYFIALRNLDVSDNKLPDLVCLASLQALVRLRAASCRLHTLGQWPSPDGVAAAAAAEARGNADAAPAAAAAGGGGGASGSRSSSARPAAATTPPGTSRPGTGASAAAEADGKSGEGQQGWTVVPDGISATSQAGSANEGGTQGGEEPPPAGDNDIDPTDGDTAAATTAAADDDDVDDDGAAGAEGTESANPSRPTSAVTATTQEVAATTTSTMPEAEQPEVEAESSTAGADLVVASLLVPPPAHPFQFLEVLDLSYNQLQPHMVLLPGSPLASLPRLMELDLSSNHFKHLPSPAEIMTAAAAVASAAAAEEVAEGRSVEAVVPVAFPALRCLRLADNGLKGGALASLAALGAPLLMHLDLSRNAITEAPVLQFLAPGVNGNRVQDHPNNYPYRNHHQQQQPSYQWQQQQPSWLQQQQQRQLSADEQKAMSERFATVLVQLAVLDLSYNKVATEAAVAPLLHLPALQRLLLAGNPIVLTTQRPHAKAAGTSATLSSKIDFGEPDAAPAKPSVANSLTNRFARVAETSPKQQQTTLVAAAAAAITAATAPERVTEAFDRMDATIEQWRLNTVMEEDEEEEDEDGEDAPEDRTFLTGIGIQERRRKGSAAASTLGHTEDGLGGDPYDDADAAASELPPAPAAAAAGAAANGDDGRPLWESITEPTERLAVALGLDPLTLPMHTGALTVDTAGAIAALRFALAHPLVEADDGLAPHPRYAATTTAAQLKRKPRRPAPSARLAPVGTSAATAAAVAGGVTVAESPKAAKIQTVEAMLDGMKGKLAALEASLAAQLAAAPAAAPPLPARAEKAKGGRYGARRAGGGGHDSDSDDDDDAGSSGSGLPDDVIDQIERESESEEEDEQAALEAEFTPLDPMQGIVLVADQIMADEATVELSHPPSTTLDVSRSQSMSPTRGGLGSSQHSRSVVARVTSPPSSSGPNLRQPSVSMQRSMGSPQRSGAAASAGGVSRKGFGAAGGAGAAGHGPAATPVGLGGGAASALGYAS